METRTAEPQAWVGCLACYNAGRLVGAWMDGTEADDRDAFEAAVSVLGGSDDDEEPHSLAHEELWVMDHQGYAGFLSGECSPMEAQRIAEVIEAIDGEGYYPIEAVAAWADHTGETITEWDRPTREAFEDAYCGEYASEREYGEQLADDIGMLSEVSESIAMYFDYDAFSRDLFLGGDNFSVEAPGGGIYVFRSV